MKDHELEKILDQAARAPHRLDPALLDRVSRSIETSMRPVRPRPSAWLLVSGLVLICATVALAAAGKAGFHGFQNQSVLQRALIIPALGIFILLAAMESVSQTIPGSRHRVSPRALLVAGCAVLLALFAFLFPDYRADHFISGGLPCLTTGLLLAIPTGLASWLILRRGFAVNSIAAALAGGTLSGLAGVAMLEFHCPSLQAPHVMLWHTAVIPLSAAAAMLLAWTLRHRTN